MKRIGQLLLRLGAPRQGMVWFEDAAHLMFFLAGVLDQPQAALPRSRENSQRRCGVKQETAARD
jgi:hypothetical protein